LYVDWVGRVENGLSLIRERCCFSGRCLLQSGLNPYVVVAPNHPSTDIGLVKSEHKMLLATIQRFALFLNQYANLLMVFASLLLVLLTAIYVGLTSRTLTALKEASLSELYR
jgi:hypothetical protein